MITIGFDIPMFTRVNGTVGKVFVTIIIFGWVFMVTGFSLVLYSRIHLLSSNPRIPHLLLLIIIANGFIVHTPGVVTAYLGNFAHAVRVRYVISKLEIVFYVQEISLSSLYIFLFARYLRGTSTMLKSEPAVQKTLVGLIVAQVVISAADVAMIVLLYQDLYLARKLLISLNYAVKVTVEFSVLNRLVRFSSKQRGDEQLQIYQDDLRGMDVTNASSDPERLDEMQSGVHGERSKMHESGTGSTGAVVRSLEISSEGRRDGLRVDVATQIGSFPARDSSSLLPSALSSGRSERNSIDESDRKYLGRSGINTPV
jgi:hypothetical protein